MLIRHGNLRKTLWPIIGVNSEILTKVLVFCLCAALEMNSAIHIILFKNQTSCSLVVMCRSKRFDIPEYKNRQILCHFLFL